jgi:hypothetical protein
MSKNSRLPLGLVVLTFAPTLAGCGDDGLEPRYPVSGQVTYNGQPLKKGKIFFVPEDSAKRQGAGEIEDGALVNVTTVNPGDGLFATKYKVMISALEPVDLSGIAKKYAGIADEAVVAKAQAKAKSLLPKKYSNAFDSGLTADVSPSNRTFNFELKD